MNPLLLRAGIAAALIAAVIGAVWSIRHWGVLVEREKSAKAEMEAAARKWQEQYALSEKLEKQLTEQRENNAKLQGKLKDETSKSRVYRDCKLPDGGLQLYNEAIQRSATR